MTDYQKHYSEKSFWTKLKNFAITVGKELIEKVLTLYYCMLDNDTPIWAKGVIASALGYFIFPVDAIPDPTPLIGFADDTGAVASAFAVVAVHIKPEHKKQAKKQVKVWFG